MNEIAAPAIKNSRKAFDEAVAHMGVNQTHENYLFYLHVIAACRSVMDDNFPAPAGVCFQKTHYTMFINPTMFGKYPVNERIGILAHEVCHIIFLHLSRIHERNPKLWNFATDLAINQMIKDIPKDGLDYKKFKLPKGLTAEQYYALLLDMAEDQKQEMEKQGTLDDHTGWGEGDGSEDSKMSQEISAEMTKKITEDIMENARQKTRGLNSPAIESLLDIIFAKEKLNWKRLIRNAFSNKRVSKVETIKRRNRRFPGRSDVNGYKKNYSSNVVALLDVSGSVSDDFIEEALTEVNGIAKKTSADIKIIQVDTQVHSIEKFVKNNPNFKRRASGGTHLYPGVEYIKQHKVPCDTLVVFTDGCIESNWDYPPHCTVIFVMQEGDTLSLNTDNFSRSPIVLNIPPTEK
jgi:predicted metal-dependent peptidase